VQRKLSNRTVLGLIGVVFVGLCVFLVVVLLHEREKPQSPQALVASAFTQIFPAKEWKPGMGKTPLVYHPAAATRPITQPGGGEWKPGLGPKPFIYHPAAATKPVWRSLPGRSTGGGQTVAAPRTQANDGWKPLP
jgi:hypothetical protein